MTTPEKSVEEKLKEFRDEIYGESDALFDRAGNNVSTQVENWLTQTLTAERQKCEEVVEVERKRVKNKIEQLAIHHKWDADFMLQLIQALIQPNNPK